ncbi:hypothetical protein GLOIN_2v1780515 [Rhizophagus irregularis DAOM 181602=DAOM 197198]|uniref:Uncharacterized protein n=1 Tax=Rhizophagus irregularis TaxID=588596 RepID=A0A2N1M4Y5_9GLOM|nr:hypothetical protein RhiirC2_799446 [Rhizophagus irregularis]GET65233.1 hypothetical protein GLOIN_2v1780515 [Rhizophagus irregularis DAOM 181602=DAOM 197198]
MKEFNDGISSLSNDSTAYNLKNYLEILPTFTIENDTTMIQILNEAFEKLKCERL